jgi:hypothetical protein
MKRNIRLAFAVLVIGLASCTSKPAENTATEPESTDLEAPATESVEEIAPVDSAAAPMDSVVTE